MSHRLEIDTREVAEQARKFNELCSRADFEIERAIAHTAEKYLQDLIRATPKKTGKLKRQWRIDNAHLPLRVQRVSGGWVIELVNTTHYASFVEKGHRKVLWGVDTGGWVYGRFFVLKTEHIWNNGKLDNVLKRQINTWLKNTLGKL